MEKTQNILSQEELDEMKNMIEEYRKVYSHATRIGKQIEDLQGEMVMVTADMQNISTKEHEFYQVIAKRLEIEVEAAKTMVLEELQKNMNEMQN
jgi:hypothetical protein